MSAACFMAIAERLTEPLLLLTPVGQVIAANRAATRALGPNLEHDDLAARSDDPDGFRRYIRLAARSGSALPGSARFAGDEVWWRCDAAVATIDGDQAVVLQLRTKHRTVGRFIALNRQIERLQDEVRRREGLEREREVLLERERDARALAEEASRFKDELLASISHELRTPLQAIAGWTALLREGSVDPATFDHALDVIERNVAAQAQLTEDLVDASLAANGRLRLVCCPVDLDAIIRDAVDGLQPAFAARGQRVVVSAIPGECIVSGDRGRLRQVVWNLLSNANKYTPKQGEIRITLDKVDSRAELIVSDTGVGISAELLPHVFDRFRRGDATTTRLCGGLGLGLAIVRYIVELHGGDVRAASPGMGLGATFTVSLPSPELRPASATTPAGTRDAGRPLAGLRVLLVEDHDDSRELLANILRVRGAEVIAVERPTIARTEFVQRSFDLVVSDIEMPDEDGYTLMRQLREIELDRGRTAIPAIAVSAHSLGDAPRSAEEAGYQAFLPKPIKPAELIAVIERLCRGA